MFEALKIFSHPKTGRKVQPGETIRIDCPTAITALLKAGSIKKWQPVKSVN